VVIDLAKFKKWIISKIDKSQAQYISSSFNVSDLVGKILAARGFKCDEITKAFLNKNADEFHNPFLLHDMENAVKIIRSAAENKCKIAVYGDYDVDGITSTYIIYDYLSSIGANVIYYIPDRINEGYGINTDAIDKLKEKNVELIITVDVGITAVNEIKYAKDCGLSVVITDHHNLKESIPDADAVINPKIESGYPFDALAGVGVAFKLVYALSGCDRNVFDKYCDIAAIGTIADMVPLCGENRYIAAAGTEKLKYTDNVGLKSLLEVACVDASKLNSSDISYSLSPRLNAAGRIASASMSVELLLEKSYEKAQEKAIELDNCNKLRQKEEQAIFEEALEIIKANNYENDNFIVVAKENWLHGVIGIVSSKLTEMFYKPTSVISINTDGTGKASGRSIKGVNIFEALSSCSNSLVKFGGHELAAGFTVKEGMIDEFRKTMNSHISQLITDEISSPFIEIDAEIGLNDINLENTNALKVLEPYGINNKAPVLCIKNVLLKNIRWTQNGKHAFLTVCSNGISKDVPAFSMADGIKSLKIGDTISLVGFLSENNFRGNTEAQFIAKDIHKNECDKCINRGELACIFGAIKTELENGNNFLNKISYMPENKKSVLLRFDKNKLETALQIFEELEILNITSTSSSLVIHEGKNFKIKTNLENSQTYNKYCQCI